VLVERRCLLVHEEAVHELVSEDGHSPFPLRRPGSRSSVDPDDLTCVADQICGKATSPAPLPTSSTRMPGTITPRRRPLDTG
jgi:hypothetical protein